MAPISSSLVNSVYDILDNKDVNLLIRNGGGVESLFKVIKLNFVSLWAYNTTVDIWLNYRAQTQPYSLDYKKR